MQAHSRERRPRRRTRQTSSRRVRKRCAPRIAFDRTSQPQGCCRSVTDGTRLVFRPDPSAARGLLHAYDQFVWRVHEAAPGSTAIRDALAADHRHFSLDLAPHLVRRRGSLYVRGVYTCRDVCLCVCVCLSVHVSVCLSLGYCLCAVRAYECMS
jgi:hypothetical protein